MPENELKLRRAFTVGLHLPEDEIYDALQYGSTPGWDSVAHVSLVASLDATFDVMLDIDDILDLSTYGKAREILAKHGVQF